MSSTARPATPARRKDTVPKQALTTRQVRAQNKEAWRLFRAGKGPRPEPRGRYRGEREAAAVGKATVASTKTRPIDPIGDDAAKRATQRLRDENRRLIELLHEEQARNRYMDALGRSAPEVVIPRTEKKSGLRENTALVIGSDWHVEEPVPAEKVDFCNEYNLEIADRRVARFFRAAHDMVQHHRASKRMVIRHMVLGLLGDLISGHIHDELIESNELAPIEAGLWLRPRLVSGIKFLLDSLDLDTLVVPTCYGNHGRVGQQKRISTGPENNFEYLFSRVLEADFAGDKRVRFVTSKSIHQHVRVYDFDTAYTHGDAVSYGGGVGGIGIPLLKALPQWDSVRRADLRVCGHFHQFRDFNRIIVNGSLIGMSPFSYFIKAPYEPPQQAFLLLDSKRGKNNVTALWVDDRSDHPKLPSLRSER